METDHTQIPTTVKEIGIHVGYLREDITELKQLVKDNAANYATRSELDDHEGRIRLLERRNDEYQGAQKQTRSWLGWVAVLLAIGEVIIYWLQLTRMR